MRRAAAADAGVASRRNFIGGMLELAAMVLAVGALPFGVRPAAAGRTRGNARTSVREHGARGDGIRDDTTSFQAAIDALPADGGTVHVPAGTYLIDPTRSVKLRSRVHLEMAGDATLQAKANAAPRAYVLLAQQLEDVEISGGRIVGDRHSHLGKDGEWGHGIRVRGCTRVTIRNIRISDCWGDGISAGGIMLKGRPSRPGRDLLIDNATCTGNRRQGLTIGSYRGAHVRGGEFSDTGGTAPAAGIDIEPDTDVARDVLIEGCLVRGNRGPGIQLYKRAAAVTIRKCTIERNRGDGILAVTAIDCVFSGNVIRNNGARGVSLRAGSRDVRISDNRFVGNLDGGRRQLRMADDSVAIRIDENNQFE